MSDRKAVIKNADMSEEMQQDAVDCATQVSNIESSVGATKKSPQTIKPGSSTP